MSLDETYLKDVDTCSAEEARMRILMESEDRTITYVTLHYHKEQGI